MSGYKFTIETVDGLTLYTMITISERSQKML